MLIDGMLIKKQHVPCLVFITPPF